MTEGSFSWKKFLAKEKTAQMVGDFSSDVLVGLLKV